RRSFSMFNEELFLYRLVKEISLDPSSKLIEINQHRNIAWFIIMDNNNKGKLVKLCTHKFGWENQFRLDMINNIAKVKELEKRSGIKLDFFTIYLSQYSPVEGRYQVLSENGEELKYYTVDENNYVGFIDQLNNDLSLQ